MRKHHLEILSVRWAAVTFSSSRGPSRKKCEKERMNPGIWVSSCCGTSPLLLNFLGSSPAPRRRLQSLVLDCPKSRVFEEDLKQKKGRRGEETTGFLGNITLTKTYIALKFPCSPRGAFFFFLSEVNGALMVKTDKGCRVCGLVVIVKIVNDSSKIA